MKLNVYMLLGRGRVAASVGEERCCPVENAVLELLTRSKDSKRVYLRKRAYADDRSGFLVVQEVFMVERLRSERLLSRGCGVVGPEKRMKNRGTYNLDNACMRVINPAF